MKNWPYNFSTYMFKAGRGIHKNVFVKPQKMVLQFFSEFLFWKLLEFKKIYIFKFLQNTLKFGDETKKILKKDNELSCKALYCNRFISDKVVFPIIVCSSVFNLILNYANTGKLKSVHLFFHSLLIIPHWTLLIQNTSLVR